MVFHLALLMLFKEAWSLAVSDDPRRILSGNYNPTKLGNTDNFINAMNAQEKWHIPMNGNALTVALDVVQVWAVILTLGFTIIVFFFLAFCVCSKKENSYDEFETTPGITTVKIYTESESNRINLSPKSPRSDQHSDVSGRYALKRELPAIPTTAASQTAVQSRPVSNVSDTATTEQGPGPVKLVGGVQVLPSQSSISSGMSQPGSANKYYQSSIESKDSGYNPYSQITTTKITANPLVASDDTDRRPKPDIVKAEIKETASRERPVTQFTSTNANSNSTTTFSAREAFFMGKQKTESKKEDHSYQTVTEVVQAAVAPQPAPAPIPAAMAISGRTPANEEMPYMTPRALQETRTEPVPQQQNFSGDSQDSRGYTSISVREPLSELKSRQTEENGGTGLPANNEAKPEAEGYYMTVSDDSADETYACIDERIQRNGNNTYAQIQNVTSSSKPTPVPSSITLPLSPVTDSAPPAPPSVDSLKHFVHSRQASSSSAASAGVSSPGTEKKPRSPLPPVPQGEPDLYSVEPVKSYPSPVEKTPQALDEMYAKVNKKKDHSRGNSMEVDFDPLSLDRSSRSVESISSPSKSQDTTPRSDIEVTNNQSVEPLPKAPLSRSAAITESLNSDKSYYTQNSDPGYETVKSDEATKIEQSDIESEPGYETLKQKTEPGYETVGDTVRNSRDEEPSYETVGNESMSIGYETVRSGNDPGYEELVHMKSAQSDCDPNYEQLKFSSDETNEPSYEVVDENFMKKYQTAQSPETKELPIYAEVKKKSESPIANEEIDNAFKVIPDVVPTDITKSPESDTESQSEGTQDEQGIAPTEQNSVPVTLNPLIQCSSPDSRFPVIDSPEDVELPPPEMQETPQPNDEIPAPPDTKPDTESSGDQDDSTDQETEKTRSVGHPAKDLSIDVPPPLPCDQDIPDLPQPVDLISNFPEPPSDYPDLPLPQVEESLIDISTDATDLPDLPAPPPVFMSEQDNETEMTVTVNPMANLDNLMSSVPPTYENSASPVNGSSVASIVTIDSQVPVSSISQSSPTETKHDSNDPIMPL